MAGKVNDRFVLHTEGLPDDAIAGPNSVVYDVLVDLMVNGRKKQHLRVMIPDISRNQVVGLLVQLLDEFLENT